MWTVIHTLQATIYYLSEAGLDAGNGAVKKLGITPDLWNLEPWGREVQ